MSTLVKPDIEATDLSLLVLADLATTRSGKRRYDRMQSLLRDAITISPAAVPGCITVLQHAGLVDVRKSSAGRSHGRTADTPGWSVEITDRGLALHRDLMATLRRDTPAAPATLLLKAA